MALKRKDINILVKKLKLIYRINNPKIRNKKGTRCAFFYIISLKYCESTA